MRFKIWQGVAILGAAGVLLVFGFDKPHDLEPAPTIFDIQTPELVIRSDEREYGYPEYAFDFTLPDDVEYVDSANPIIDGSGVLGSFTWDRFIDPGLPRHLELRIELFDQVKSRAEFFARHEEIAFEVCQERQLEQQKIQASLWEDRCEELSATYAMTVTPYGMRWHRLFVLGGDYAHTRDGLVDSFALHSDRDPEVVTGIVSLVPKYLSNERSNTNALDSFLRVMAREFSYTFEIPQAPEGEYWFRSSGRSIRIPEGYDLEPTPLGFGGGLFVDGDAERIGWIGSPLFNVSDNLQDIEEINLRYALSRCAADGPSGSTHCDKVLEDDVIEGDGMRGHRFMLNEIHEKYVDGQLSTSTSQRGPIFIGWMEDDPARTIEIEIFRGEHENAAVSIFESFRILSDKERTGFVVPL